MKTQDELTALLSNMTLLASFSFHSVSLSLSFFFSLSMDVVNKHIYFGAVSHG